MKLTVYHGSAEIIRNPVCRFGRPGLDFGRGFYVTTMKEQAVRWAKRVGMNRDLLPLLNVYTLDREAILSEGKCKVFTAYDADWLRFIVANRLGQDIACQFDYIEGGVADDRVIDSIMEYMQGRIDEELALQNLSFHKPNNQICLLSQSLTDKYLQYDHTEQL